MSRGSLFAHPHLGDPRRGSAKRSLARSEDQSKSSLLMSASRLPIPAADTGLLHNSKSGKKSKEDADAEAGRGTVEYAEVYEAFAYGYDENDGGHDWEPRVLTHELKVAK